MPGILDLKSTLNLPQTTFSMKANLPQNEPKWLAKWAEQEPLRADSRRAPGPAPLHLPRWPALR